MFKGKKTWSQTKGLKMHFKVAKIEKLDTHPYLVAIKFDIDHWHTLDHLVVVFDYTMDSLRYIFQNQVKVQFIFFCC